MAALGALLFEFRGAGCRRAPQMSTGGGGGQRSAIMQKRGALVSAGRTIPSYGPAIFARCATSASTVRALDPPIAPAPQIFTDAFEREKNSAQLTGGFERQLEAGAIAAGCAPCQATDRAAAVSSSSKALEMSRRLTTPIRL